MKRCDPTTGTLPEYKRQLGYTRTMRKKAIKRHEETMQEYEEKISRLEAQVSAMQEAGAA